MECKTGRAPGCFSCRLYTWTRFPERSRNVCRAPLMKSVLLYGAPKTGKTSLCQAIAHAAGANFFDLSPRNTDAKYPGKAAALMIHMVCAFLTKSVTANNVLQPHRHNSFTVVLLFKASPRVGSGLRTEFLHWSLQREHCQSQDICVIAGVLVLQMC